MVALEQSYVGAEEQLSENESKVDTFLINLKKKQEIYNDDMNFSLKKLLQNVRKSPLHKFFKQMPKGGSLHTHLKGINIDSIFKEENHENLWMKGSFDNAEERPKFKFCRHQPASSSNSMVWKPISRIKSEMGSEQFNENFAKLFFLPEISESSKEAWEKFQTIFDVFGDFIENIEFV